MTRVLATQDTDWAATSERLRHSAAPLRDFPFYHKFITSPIDANSHFPRRGAMAGGQQRALDDPRVFRQTRCCARQEPRPSQFGATAAREKMLVYLCCFPAPRSRCSCNPQLLLKPQVGVERGKGASNGNGSGGCYTNLSSTSLLDRIGNTQKSPLPPAHIQAEVSSMATSACN